MPYSLDTSGLLDGWVRYYAPEVFPSLWKQMEAAAADGTIALFSYLAPSESADERVVSLNFTSWDQIGKWLRRVEALRDAA